MANPSSMETLGIRLKAARKASGLTFAQLSEVAGIAVGQIHKLENDRVTKVNPAHLAALAGPLGLPLHQLFAWAGYPVERLQMLEPELARRLSELPPPALEQITDMLHAWLDAQRPTWSPTVTEQIDVAETTT